MNVDFVLSCGNACRPAHYAQKLCQRRFSSPCDWMMNYSLDHFIDVLRTEGSHMFRNAKYDETNKWVCDIDNGMISMHDFDSSQSLDTQLPDFHKKMVRRAKNTVKQILQSHRVGIIMNRKIEKSELIDFAQSLQSMFPECFFYIVNIKDIPSQDFLKTELVTQTTRYKITEISFNDAHDNGRDKSTNPKFWLGNVRIWEHLMLNHFHVKGQRYRFYAANIKNLLKRIKILLDPFYQGLSKYLYDAR